MDRKRRQLLLSGMVALGNRMLPISLGAAAATRSGTVPAQGGLPARIEFDPAPFTLGVASGDPTPSSVIIWTRYAPDPLDGQGGMTSDTTVWWAVATDPSFSIPSLVNMGPVPATVAGGGAVHVDVTGLDPDTVYYYMFWDLQQTTSAVGKTKTTPLGTVASARFAFISCQDMTWAGIGGAPLARYGAFERMVEEDLDFIVHAGDAIYEHTLDGATWPPELNNLPFDQVEGYRIRHAAFRGDPQLRAAYEAVPWFLTWDDHEVFNNYWDADFYPPFLAVRAAAYQAWYEHMPIRAPAGMPNGPDFQIYRSFAYGDLLDLMILDTRQYRDKQPPSSNSTKAQRNDPNRTMLGSTQKQWLKNELSASTAAWRGVVSGVTMMEALADHDDPTAMADTDAWNGYAYERTDLLGHIASEQIPDVVVMHGNPHQSLFGNLRVDPQDLQMPIVASEIGGTPVTSGPGAIPPENLEAGRAVLYDVNPHICYWETGSKGYVLCDVSTNLWTSTIRTVDRTDPDAPAQTLATFQTIRGVPGIEMTSGTGGNPNCV